MTAIFNKVATKVFGSANERLLKRLWPKLDPIKTARFEPGQTLLRRASLGKSPAKTQVYLHGLLVGLTHADRAACPMGFRHRTDDF